MQKKFLFLVFCLCFILTLCGCDKATKSIILFNKEPITKNNLLSNATEFTAGKRIYYIFITEEPIKVDFIRVRIFKREEKADFTPSKLVYSNDFRPYKDQVYYYNDYIVMGEAGYYCMYVYLKNQLNSPIAIADFRVKN